MSNTIKKNIRSIISSVPKHVKILAVAKYRTTQEIITSIQMGITDIGFNYLQEALDRMNEFKKHLEINPQFHFIGKLQSNKVKKVVTHFDSIQTVSTLKIATLIDQYAQNLSKTMDIMIQIRPQEEEHKNGLLLNEVVSFIKSLSSLSNIKIIGLMTMGGYSYTQEKQNEFFSQCNHLFHTLKEINQKNLSIKQLSMGMSDNYLLAVKNGANYIRIGTGIYGKRSI